MSTGPPPSDSLAPHTPYPPFRASDHKDGKKHLLLAASGSVATIKIPQIISALSHHSGLSVRLILTSSAANFLAGQSAEQPSVSSFNEIPNLDGIYQDADEWSPAWTRGAPILHIELRRWAHILVVAPLSANTMTKMVAGMADSLLTSVMRAWDTTGFVDDFTQGTVGPKPLVLAPAMNTAMWHHPVTKKQLDILEGEWGWDSGGWVVMLRPVEKQLACGDTGDGAMREWKEVVEIIEERLQLRKDGGLRMTKF
jgi:phosphopantothenoylcysteine decarboxylase